MMCSNCNGTGEVLRKTCTVDGIQYPEVIVRCFVCDGSGELCDACGESLEACICDDNEGGRP